MCNSKSVKFKNLILDQIVYMEKKLNFYIISVLVVKFFKYIKKITVCVFLFKERNVLSIDTK